jgi:hypothetical protein
MHSQEQHEQRDDDLTQESQGLGPTFKEGTPTAVLSVVERLSVNIVTKPASERYSAFV